MLPRIGAMLSLYFVICAADLVCTGKAESIPKIKAGRLMSRCCTASTSLPGRSAFCSSRVQLDGHVWWASGSPYETETGGSCV